MQRFCVNVETPILHRCSLYMARRSPQAHAKRQREQAKQEKRREKEAKRALRKAPKPDDSDDALDGAENEDSGSELSGQAEAEPSAD